MKKVRLFLRRFLPGQDPVDDVLAAASAEDEQQHSDGGPCVGPGQNAPFRRPPPGHASYGWASAMRPSAVNLKDPERPPRARGRAKVLQAAEARRRRSSTHCEVTYLKKLDAAQAACLHQRFEPRGKSAATADTRCSSASPPPATRTIRDRSRPAVQKCDFSQMVQERQAREGRRPDAGAVKRTSPLALDTQVAVVVPVPRVPSAASRGASASSMAARSRCTLSAASAENTAVKDSPAPTTTPLFAGLNHSMQTQTSFSLDAAVLRVRDDALLSLESCSGTRRESATASRTSIMSGAKAGTSWSRTSVPPVDTGVASSGRSSTVPSRPPSRVRLGEPAKSESQIGGTLDPERGRHSASWPTMPRTGATSAPTTHSGTNTMPILTVERCVSTDDEGVRVVGVHAAACPGACKPPDGGPGLVIEEAVVDGRKGLVLSPAPSQPPTKQLSFLTVAPVGGGGGGPLRVSVMPCVSWAHVPDGLSMTDSLGLPLPDLKLQVIPYPCPCHPLDALIRGKVVEKMISSSQNTVVVVVDESGGPSLKSGPSETTGTADGDTHSLDMTVGGVMVEGSVAAAAGPSLLQPPPPEAERTSYLSGAPSSVHPITTTGRISTRSPSADAGQGGPRAVEEAVKYPTTATLPMPFLLGSKPRPPYDASEFTGREDSGQEQEESDGQQGVPAREPEDGRESPGDGPEAPDQEAVVDVVGPQPAAEGPAPTAGPDTPPDTVPPLRTRSSTRSPRLKGAYSAAEFTAREGSVHSRLGSIASQISAELCSLGARSRVALLDKPEAVAAGTASAGSSRAILTACRRTSRKSVRSKASSPAVQIQVSPAEAQVPRTASHDVDGFPVVPEDLPADAAPGHAVDESGRDTDCSEKQAGDDFVTVSEDDPGDSASEDGGRHRRPRPPSQRGGRGPSHTTRRPPARKSTRRGSRRAAKEQPRRVPDLRVSARQTFDESDRVESLWISPWTKQAFPSSNSIIHVVGEGSRQQFQLDAEASLDAVVAVDVGKVGDATGRQMVDDSCLGRPKSASTAPVPETVKPLSPPPPPPQVGGEVLLPGVADKCDAAATPARVQPRVAAARGRAPFGLRPRKVPPPPAAEPNVETFECKVCTDYLSPPVRRCAAGHGVCPACLKEAAAEGACPVCGQAVAGSAALDQLARTVLFPCKHAGCKELYWIEDRGRHEARCPLRPRPCPCATRSQVMCPWSGLRSAVRGHLRRAHGHHGVVYPYRTFFPLEDLRRAAWAGRTYHVEIVFVEHEMFELHKVFDERNARLWGLLRHILARDAAALFSYTIRFQPANMRPVVTFRNDALCGAEDLDKAFAQGKRFSLHLDCFTKKPVDVFTVQLKVQPRDRSRWP